MEFAEYVIGTEKYRYMMDTPPKRLKRDVYYVTYNNLSGEDMRDIIDSLEGTGKEKVTICDEDGERSVEAYVDEQMCYFIKEM